MVRNRYFFSLFVTVFFHKDIVHFAESLVQNKFILMKHYECLFRHAYATLTML